MMADSWRESLKKTCLLAVNEFPFGAPVEIEAEVEIK